MDIPGRPVPTTFECIEAIAWRDPQRLALVQDAQTWTFQALFADLGRVVRALDRLGVRRGQRVAVGTAGLQAGLLLLIACENLGAVTTSFLPRNDPDTEALFGMVDWVISDAAQACPASAKFQLLDNAFLNEVSAIDPGDAAACPRVALEPHEPQRISRTSGSSGRSRFMLLSRQAQEYWVRSGAENGGYRPESRLLVAGPLVMNAVFARSCACLRMGAAALDVMRTGPQGHDVTHVLALPALLEDLLDRLPADYAPGWRVEVGTVGGFVSAPLRERAARVFGGRISSRYGANEVTGICDDLDANGIGVVSAGVDIRVVNEAGEALPAGEIGIVAVRTPGMVDAYIGDEAATRAAFRDGWFYSGDWGALVAPRVLRLAGRHDDLVNVAGVKVPAAQIEAKVRELTQVGECAVLAVNLQSGAITVGIALAVSPDAAQEALLRALDEGLRLGPTVGAKVIFVASLPRMANGKLDRIALQRLFQAAGNEPR
jgi:acyl-coenzyme A synthetase/AMP-(fatty) acid ligase